MVCVVMELRQEDVVREFLEGWLGRKGWEIRRVPSSGSGGDGEEGNREGFLEGVYAVWVGWKGG